VFATDIPIAQQLIKLWTNPFRRRFYVQALIINTSGFLEIRVRENTEYFYAGNAKNMLIYIAVAKYDWGIWWKAEPVYQ